MTDWLGWLQLGGRVLASTESTTFATAVPRLAIAASSVAKGCPPPSWSQLSAAFDVWGWSLPHFTLLHLIASFCVGFLAWPFLDIVLLLRLAWQRKVNRLLEARGSATVVVSARQGGQHKEPQRAA